MTYPTISSGTYARFTDCFRRSYFAYTAAATPGAANQFAPNSNDAPFHFTYLKFSADATPVLTDASITTFSGSYPVRSILLLLKYLLDAYFFI